MRQLLGHGGGLVLLDEEVRIAQMRDLDDLARSARAPDASVAARHAPRLPRDVARAVHAGADPHVDPAHRALRHFFHEEVAVPLGLEFYIGLPLRPDERLATVKTLSITRALLA